MKPAFQRGLLAALTLAVAAPGGAIAQDPPAPGGTTTQPGGLDSRPKRPTDPKDFTAGMMAGPYDVTIAWAGGRTSKVPGRIVSSRPDFATLQLSKATYTLKRSLGTPFFGGSKASGTIVGALLDEQAQATSITLVIVQLNKLTGQLKSPDGRVLGTLTLWRSSLAPLSAQEQAEFDAGPPPAIQAHMDSLAAYDKFKSHYWFNFGPVFYRGRLDGTAKLMGIASDPGPTECLPMVRRCLVGDAGQRTQGFLTKLGLTRSYVLANAHAYAIFPSHASGAVPPADLAKMDPAFVTDLTTRYGAAPTWGQTVMNDPDISAWRNTYYNQIAGPSLQAIVVFGAQSRDAIRLWIKGEAQKTIKDRFGAPLTCRVATLPDGREIPIFYVQHPSAYDPSLLLDTWRGAVAKLRKIVTPDQDAPNPLGPNYGDEFTENDYARIPRRDLPKDAPAFIGDDSWGRAQRFPQNNSADRPQPDDRRTLIFESPPSANTPERLFTVTGPNPENPNRTPVFAESVAVTIDAASLVLPAQAFQNASPVIELTGTSAFKFDRILIRQIADNPIIKLDAYAKVAPAGQGQGQVPQPWKARVTLPRLKKVGTYSIVLNSSLGTAAIAQKQIVVVARGGQPPAPVTPTPPTPTPAPPG